MNLLGLQKKCKFFQLIEVDNKHLETSLDQPVKLGFWLMYNGVAQVLKEVYHHILPSRTYFPGPHAIDVGDFLQHMRNGPTHHFLPLICWGLQLYLMRVGVFLYQLNMRDQQQLIVKLLEL